jgi:hypothetical protein
MNELIEMACIIILSRYDPRCCDALLEWRQLKIAARISARFVVDADLLGSALSPQRASSGMAARGAPGGPVEHVHVHAGGRAVVGTVQTPGGGGREKSEDQPHAKQIAHAPQPAVWSADKEREPVPVTKSTSTRFRTHSFETFLTSESRMVLSDG